MIQVIDAVPVCITLGGTEGAGGTIEGAIHPIGREASKHLDALLPPWDIKGDQGHFPALKAPPAAARDLVHGLARQLLPASD